MNGTADDSQQISGLTNIAKKQSESDHLMGWMLLHQDPWLHIMPGQYYQAGDTRIPLPRKPLWTPQKIVDCKVGLCTSLRTVAEFL